MNSFLKNIISSAIGVLLAILMMVGSIFILIIISGLINLIFNASDNIEPNSIVKLKMNYDISDKPNTDPFANFTPFGDFEPNNSMHLYKILTSIHLASENENIAGIMLDLNEFNSPGMASLKEIRDALKKFQKNGKFIYAYSKIYSKSSYYLGSIADSIFMYPTGAMELSGLSSTTPFYTETMKEIGVKPEIIRHGKFKAAVEPFMLTEMSEENREQTSTLLNDIWNTMLEDIAKSRKISIATLNNLADDITISMLPKKPVEHGLIDQLIYPDELNNLLKEKLQIKGEEKINFTNLSNLKEGKNKSKNKIAIIYAEGGIDGNDANIHSGYTKTIKKVLENDDINAVVFRINSPGGSALISDEILSQMKLSKKNKPIIVSMGNYAASGGYYIACAADKILASPMTITGSIGVFGLFFTGEELLTKKIKLHYSNVKTNKFSNLGEIHRSLSDKERSFIQMSVKNTYNDFITHVAENRNMTLNEVDKIGQGRVWTGLRGEKIGIVDSIGGLTAAIETAAKLAEIDNFKLEEYPKIKNSVDMFLQTLEDVKLLNTKTIEKIYFDQIEEKILNMQGIQALLPVEYNID
ncbi:MAG: signal peptide peptidase SppA [Flavobacteriales bacterium]|nr:signal peptide peptidase SppA [Flavobacteriales bacterium]|tara:strand:- start:12914 stop:14662 length:1749 start_codon:yes stop_codon:yes gene_type:complete